MKRPREKACVLWDRGRGCCHSQTIAPKSIAICPGKCTDKTRSTDTCVAKSTTLRARLIEKPRIKAYRKLSNGSISGRLFPVKNANAIVPGERVKQTADITSLKPTGVCAGQPRYHAAHPVTAATR